MFRGLILLTVLLICRHASTGSTTPSSNSSSTSSHSSSTSSNTTSSTPSANSTNSTNNIPTVPDVQVGPKTFELYRVGFVYVILGSVFGGIPVLLVGCCFIRAACQFCRKRGKSGKKKGKHIRLQCDALKGLPAIRPEMFQVNNGYEADHPSPEELREGAVTPSFIETSFAYQCAERPVYIP